MQDFVELEAFLLDNVTDKLSLLNYPESDDWQHVKEIVESLKSGDYEDVLKTDICQEILGKRNVTDIIGAITNIEDYLVESIKRFLGQNDDNLSRQFCTLMVGISCLQLFVQNNWVGPPTEEDSFQFLPSKFCADDQIKKTKEFIQDVLSLDTEPIYGLSRQTPFFFLARVILLNCNEQLTGCQSADWWLLRFLQTHQALFQDRSPTLKATVMQLIEKIGKKEPLMTDEKNRDLLVMFDLEAAHLAYFYYEPSLAKEYFTQAKKHSELEIELTGALGKRTKFQQNELAQLVLKVERTQDNIEHLKTLEKPDPKDMPKNVSVDDDTVLNDIKFKEDQQFVVETTGLEQAVILGLSFLERKSREGQGKIIEEIMLAYYTCILSQTRNWAVHSTAMFHRAYWESESSRKIQRCMEQLEELVSQFRRKTPNLADRLHLVYCTRMPSTWVIETQLGDFFKKMGAHNAALEVYLRLQIWEEIIECYQKTGRTEKAEAVIREQLAIKETPSLLCYLGDVTLDTQYYKQAWELSNGRSARAQRSWGYLLLRKGKFEESLEHFEKSLEINALQNAVWFSYGCAALTSHHFDKAARGFRRCVTIDHDNFEAWSNLATAYIKLRQKPRAFNALQESLKCEFENWRIWENYLLVGTDIGEFAESIRAYHRLIDLKHKYGDAEVLRILVRAVNQGIKDPRGVCASNLRTKLTELFGRVTSTVTNDADIWRYYAELLNGNPEVSQQDKERALQYLQKCFRCLTQKVNWEKDPVLCKSIAEESAALTKTYIAVSETVENPTQTIQMLSTARLMLKGVCTKIKQHHTDPVTDSLVPDLMEPFQKLEAEFQKLVELINEKKGS